MAMTPTDARAAYDGELVDELDRQVRGLVRGEGVDPQRDAGWYAGSSRASYAITTSGA